MMTAQQIITLDELRDLYYDKHMSFRQIASRFGIGWQSVSKLLRKYNLKRRPIMKSFDCDLLQHLYIDGQLSSIQIGKRLGVSHSCIRANLERNNIHKRTRLEAVRLARSQGRGSIAPMKGKTGPNYPLFKGKTKANGYWFVYRPEHPRASRQGYVREHIVVWEETHHQLLPRDRVIHHINQIKTDNRPENLVALASRNHHKLNPILVITIIIVPPG